MYPCPSCGSEITSEYANISGHMIFSCNKCTLLFNPVDEEKRKKFIKKQYETGYAIDYEEKLSKFNERYKNFLHLINRYKTDGNLLDIGCGTGFFLKYVKKNSFFNPYGVEPNDKLRKVAKLNSKLNIATGSLDQIPYNDNFFDVITCLDVLEHSININNNITELKRVLKPNGLLLLQVPNYKSYMAYITGEKWDWWSIPDHVLHFSFDFISQYMQNSGFIILKKFTYQDRNDFILNIMGIFKKNMFTKCLFIILMPILHIIGLLSVITNRGGLSLLLLKKL